MYPFMYIHEYIRYVCVYMYMRACVCVCVCGSYITLHLLSPLSSCAVVKSRKSNCVKEVERLKKNREERRWLLVLLLMFKFH